MLICASTACFPELSLLDAIDRLVDLEFSNVEIALHERRNQLKPSEVAANLEAAIHACRDTHRLGVAAYEVEINFAPAPDWPAGSKVCCDPLSFQTEATTLGTSYSPEVGNDGTPL